MKRIKTFQLVIKVIALAIVLAYGVAFFGTYDTAQALAMTGLAALISLDFVILARQSTNK